MTGIRVMTYNVNRCRGRSKTADPDAVASVIGAAAPDVVALQGVDAGCGEDHLSLLAARLGMRPYASSGHNTTAYLSYYPLRGVIKIPLGEGDNCLRAEIDVGQKRLFFFNVQLEVHSGRCAQFSELLGEELLGNRRTSGAPSLILGDFGGCRQRLLDWTLHRTLHCVSKPLVHATYPAGLPLFSRDRAYIQGNELRVLETAVVRDRASRQASSHLPFLMTLQIVDTRIYIKVDESLPRGIETATG